MITKYIGDSTYAVLLVSTGRSIELNESEIKELNTHDLNGKEIEDVEELNLKIDELNEENEELRGMISKLEKEVKK